jgi:DNA polymerase
MFIGEAPGKDEDKQLKPFIGKTGREVNEHYLPLAGLRRDNVYFTNAIKCLPPGHGGKLDLNRSKDLELLYSCSNHSLYSEISAVRPKLIVPLGAFACHSIDPSIELDLQHGIPLETSFGTVFPMYHPAGGIHEPKKMLQIRTDWYRLGKYLKGKLNVPEDEREFPYYSVWDDNGLLDSDGSYPLACDTEVTRFMEPFCITFSDHPGTGHLILATDNEKLNLFQTVLDKQTGPILFHNWLFDCRVVAAMALRFPRHLIVDTMSCAFHLGNLPQGLKALAKRELGMEMQDFDDLTLPYSKPIMLEYLRKAAEISWPKPEEQLVRDSDGTWKLYKPQSMSTKLKRFFTDYSKNPNKDLRDIWDNWEDSHAEVEAVCGPWPGMDIRHVPFEKVLHYACRDSDATLRLWHREQQMTRRVRWTVQEQWGETI